MMSVPTYKDIPKDINKMIGDHLRLYLSDPAAAHMWDATGVGINGAVTTLLLTTTGRKSGEPRSVPLLYVDHNDSYLIIGSKGGNVEHPVWFLNLQANPECEIRVGAPPVKARARILEGEERAAAWKKITDRHPVYAKYQARAPREIPVVMLERI